MGALSILTIAVFAAMAIFIVNKIYCEWNYNQVRSEIAYEKQYSIIQNYIYAWPVNKQSYSAIFAELKRLGNMKYKNKEKTATLTCEFLRKYTETDEEFECNQLNEEEIYSRLKLLNEAKAI